MNENTVTKPQNIKPGQQSLLNRINEYLLIPVLYILFCLCFLPLNYSAFHFFAEFGSVLAGILAFVTAIVSYRFLQNSFLLILAIGLGWSAVLDLAHIAAYQGMNLLPASRPGTELAAQLWVIARFVQASTSLLAVLLIGRTVSRTTVNFSIAIFSLAILAVLFTGYFPDTFVPGNGLTDFKIYAEFIIIALFVTAGILLIVRRKYLHREVYLGVLMAFAVMVLAELCFTAYFTVYDDFNIAGHVLKIFAYWFVFRILVLIMIQVPFRERGKLIIDLKERVKELRALHDLSTISDQAEISQQQLLQGTCELLPAAFYYPEFLHVSISSPWGDFGDASAIGDNRRIEEEIILVPRQKIRIVVGYADADPVSDPVFLKEEYILMNMVATRIRDVLVRIGSNQEISKLKELYALLSRINRAITKSNTRDTLISGVLQAIRKSSSYTAVVIAKAEFQRDSESYQIIHQDGFDDGKVPELEYLLNKLPEELLYASPSEPELGSQTPVIISVNSEEQATIARHLRETGFSHLVLVPLFENRKISFIMGLYLNAKQHLSSEYKRLLQDLQADLEYALRAFNETRKRIQAENLMMDSEERFRVVFMKSPVPMVMFDIEGKSKGLGNQAFEDWSGIPPEIELSPREYLESYLQGPDKDSFIQEYWSGALKQVSRSEVVVQVPEVNVRHYDGSELVASAKMIRINNQVLLALTDLTEIRQQEQELQESETRFRSMIEEASLPVSICHDGVFVYINPCLRELLGNDPEPVGRHITDYFEIIGESGSDAETGWGPPPGEQSVSHDVAVKGLEGDGCILSMRVSNISWDGGRACMTVGEDVTLRRKFEKELGESFELLNNLSEQIPGVIYQFQLFPDGRYCFPFTSERIREIYEVNPEEIKQEASIVLDRIHPDDRDAVEKSIYESAENLTDWIEDYRVLLPERGERWRSGYARPQKMSDGSVLWHGFIEDSTDRMNDRLELDKTNRELERSMKGTLEVLSRMVDLRDPYTAGHERRVGELAALIGAKLGMDEHEVENLRLAGLVHDIGKIAIPAEILSKPARISDSEYELIKTHAQAGYEILKGVPLNNKIKEAIWQHHERLDGSGYPRGLKGDDISLEARILAVSDVIESMASHRPYRPAKGMSVALEELTENSGLLYDERVVVAARQVVSREGFDLELL